MIENQLQYFQSVKPPRDCLNNNYDQNYIVREEGGKIHRKIFCNQQLTNQEQQMIEKLKEEVVKRKIVLPPIWTDLKYLHYSHSGGFKIEQSIKNIQTYIEWINTPSLHVLNDRMLDIFKSKIVTIYGKDRQYRPLIIFSVDDKTANEMTQQKIIDFIQTTSYLMFNTQKYLFVPQKIENWIMIIDLNNISLYNAPITLVQQLLQTLNVYFTCSLERTFILNAPYIIRSCWYLISGLLEPSVSQKYMVLQSNQLDILQKYIDKDQLQQKHGGTQPNLQYYWPLTPTYQIEQLIDDNQIMYYAYTKQQMQIDKSIGIVKDEQEEFYTCRSSSENNDDYLSEWHQDHTNQLIPFDQIQINYYEQKKNNCGSCGNCW